MTNDPSECPPSPPDGPSTCYTSYTSAVDYAQTGASGQIVALNVGASSLYGSTITLNAATTASEVRINGNSSDILQSMVNGRRRAQSLGLTAAPLFVLLEGAPPLVLQNLDLDLSSFEDVEAFSVHGGSLVVQSCSLQGARSRAIRLTGGDVIIENSLLSGNSGLHGGAVDVSGGTLTISDSRLTGNEAQVGGAINANGTTAIVYVSNSALDNNTAIEQGGAINVDGGARVVLRDRTRLRRNTAPVSRQLHLGRHGSRVSYGLPVPRGHWVANSVNCTEQMDNEACTDTGADVAVAFLIGSSNDDFPFQCAPGLYGDSLEPRQQSSPQCSDACPAGYNCTAATVVPQICPNGTYCVVGSAAPTPCEDGTYGPTEGLAGQEECIVCEAGFYCRGGFRYPCDKGEFNTQTRQSSDGACQSCPDRATTLFSASISLEQCVCQTGYFDVSATQTLPQSNASVECLTCGVGTDCPDGVEGITLETLPLKEGYYRPTAASTDIRLCPDASTDCGDLGSECYSGCRGGNDTTRPCYGDLYGTYCQLCDEQDNSTTRRYYVDASGGERSYCETCGDLGVTAVGIGLVILIGVPILYMVATKAFAHLPLKALARLKRYYVYCTPGNKLKIMLGFYQICVKVGSVYHVELPPPARRPLETIELIISFGIDGLAAPLTCMGLSGYLSKLQFMIACPIVLIGVVILGCMIKEVFRARAAADAHRLRRNSSSMTSTRNTVDEEGSSKGKDDVSTPRDTPRKGSPKGSNTGASRFSLDTPRDTPRKGSPKGSNSKSGRFSFMRVMETAAHPTIQILFLVYPVITTTAFEAWVCDNFDEGGWLTADVSIRCGSDTHDEAKSIAILAIALYPAGCIVLSGVLLLCARRDIQRAAKDGSHSTPLTRSLAFLYREYLPLFFFWETLEMARRLLLVGLMLIIVTPGSMAQLVIALLANTAFMFVQMRASPYKSLGDDWTAQVSSFCITALFVCCILFKFQSLTELSDIYEVMTWEQRRLYELSGLTTAVVMSIFGSLVFTGVLLVVQIEIEQERMRFEARALKARRLRYHVDGQPGAEVVLKPPAVGPAGFHFFLSHVWGTGQDQMRIVKQRLLEMIPDMRVFLGKTLDSNFVCLFVVADRVILSALAVIRRRRFEDRSRPRVHASIRHCASLRLPRLL